MAYKVILSNGLETGHTNDRERAERTFMALAKVGRCSLIQTYSAKDNVGYIRSIAESVNRSNPKTLGDFEDAIFYNPAYREWCARPEYLV